VARTEPRSGYFEPEDQPASITPYTAMEDRARKSRIPTGGSATCRNVSWPKIDTTPFSSPSKLPPMGTMQKARNAGMIDR